MVVLTGPVHVPNPTPQTLRYGLFTVANGPLDMPGHGADGGITYLSTACGIGSGFEVHCIDSLGEKGPFTDPMDNVVATPFVVTNGFECAPVGLTQQERDRFAFEKLRATEQQAVEQIFSEGSFGQSPSLANNVPQATDVGATTGVHAAFSALEEAFYDTYGYSGVIHLPHSASAFAEAAPVMSMQGRIWRTAASTAVSIGNYSGLSPAGAAPAANATWVYITPPVTIWRATDANVFISPIEGALNRETNEVTMIAEREYVVAYDACPTFATEMTLVEGL